LLLPGAEAAVGTSSKGPPTFHSFGFVFSHLFFIHFFHLFFDSIFFFSSIFFIIYILCIFLLLPGAEAAVGTSSKGPPTLSLLLRQLPSGAGTGAPHLLMIGDGRRWPMMEASSVMVGHHRSSWLRHSCRRKPGPSGAAGGWAPDARPTSTCWLLGRAGGGGGLFKSSSNFSSFMSAAKPPFIFHDFS